MTSTLLEGQFKRLTEVGSVGRGKSKHRPRNDPQLYGGKYPFIQTGDVKAALFYLTTYSQTYNDRGLSQSKLWPPGTLCITIAANIADTAILGIPACFPDSIIGFTPSAEKSDAKYIKYCLDTYKIRIQAISQGTTQDNLSVEKLLSFRFRIPDYTVQKKIAAVLSAYDDLIENNRRRIALLERMAEQLYREWFVRFRFPGHQHAKFEKGRPASWPVRKLPEIAKITYGFPFEGQRFNSNGSGKPIIRIRNVLDASTADYTDQVAPEKYLVRSGDLLIGMDGGFHMNHWHGDDAYLVQRVCRIEPKRPELAGYLSWALRAPVKHFEATIVGATVGHLGAMHLNSIEIAVPEGRATEIFEPLNQLLKQKLTLARVSDQLAKTRDLLLPRLISGKLRVDNLDIQFPPSMQAECA